MSTDLSACFDTVDHGILKTKMEHYGIRGKELALFSSYLKDRMFYMEINTKRSKVMVSELYSVIQGSKLSSLLYTIYVNELPLLHKLLEDEEVMKELANTEPISTGGKEHEVQHIL